MSGPGYVFKDSGTTPPAVDEHLETNYSQTHAPFVQQTHSQLSPHTYAKFGPGTSAQPEQVQTNLEQTIAQNDTARLPRETPASATDSTLTDKARAVVDDTTDILRKNFVADSHELAYSDHEVKGAVQVHDSKDSDVGVRDLGWHKPTAEIPDPLIGGLPNGRLWAMIRRFNKDVFDVRAVPMEVASGLDLNESWTQDHAGDKLTLHLQRVYLRITLNLASFGKQVSRLRSWKETRRTTAFCVAYFIAWLLDMLMPLFLGMLIVVIASKSARNVLFPPVPLALVDITTGGIQSPPAGQLGTTNTLTGAPEKQEGEAAEEEAANFIDNGRHLVMRAIGMHDKQEKEGDPLEGKVPKPVRNAVKAIKAEGSAPGHTTKETDQTQKPMEALLWSRVNPQTITPIINLAPHVVGEIVDNWERFANAISPTPPFSPYSFVRIEGVLLPLFFMSLFVNYYMIYKGVGFAIGFGFFGDPILSPSLRWLNRKYPNWVELLEPKNNILRGVPTNSQLTLTLLRIGEAHNTPLPPVPTSNPDDPNHQNYIDVDEVPLDASRAEVVDAIQPSQIEETHPDDKAKDEEKAPKHKHLSRIIRVLKGNTKAAVETKLAVDHVRATLGSEKAKGHLGVLPKPKNLIYAGPSEFKARFDGKKGWLSITETDNPYLVFTHHDPRQESQRESDAVFKIAVKDIKVLKRATAFASKPAEMAADFSSEKELLGSVEIGDKSDKVWRFTAVPERDELFNRLIAIGGQRWENY